ncbi:DNA polymerase III subunit beta [Candidatus Bipolaricaulota bacterium]|nr:DNA polymerase III subunit beta [Candidatus Bipolaricaulota bacterium]
MEFICAKEYLIRGVKMASYALGTRSAMPILTGVKLETKGDRLYICATDLEKSIQCAMPIENRAEDGAIVLDGTVLAQITTHLPPDDKVSVQTITGADESGGMKIRLQSGEATFDLLALSLDDYPEIPQLPETKICSIDKALFQRSLYQTTFAALKVGETTRISLTGVNMLFQSNGVRLLATNGYRLALKRIEVQGLVSEGEYLIDAAALAALDSQVLSAVDDDAVEMYKNGAQLFFKMRDVTVMTKVIEEEFPSFDRTIPQEHRIGLIFERIALLDTLQRMAITAAKESGAIALRVNREETAIQVSSSSPDKGKTEERVRLKREPAEEIEILFRGEFLVDALKRMSSEEVVLWLTEPDKAGLLEPQAESDALGSDNGFVYLCMPIEPIGTE